MPEDRIGCHPYPFQRQFLGQFLIQFAGQLRASNRTCGTGIFARIVIIARPISNK
ncbi:hypothetical protein BM590_A1718 [Brucella melitensis M5-90]|nr:hypothetical protein BM28_A1727 [Brucella melitensis M28]ADZ87663.1 hypothetical protein BM590_A1718 [Brucella melitensis M5-90]AEW17126.1 hypothetical protein BAA13334_I01223 [Brucella abortus A13334]